MQLKDVARELEAVLGRPTSAWSGDVAMSTEVTQVGSAEVGGARSLLERVSAAAQFRELGQQHGLHLASLEQAPAVVALEASGSDVTLTPLIGEMERWNDAWLANIERAPCVARVLARGVARLLVGVPRHAERPAMFCWVENESFELGAGWELATFLRPKEWPALGSLDQVLALGRLGRLWTASRAERGRLLAGERGASHEAKQRVLSLAADCWRGVLSAAQARFGAVEPDALDGRGCVALLDDVASLSWAVREAGVTLPPELASTMSALDTAMRSRLPSLVTPDLRDDPLVRAVSWQEPDQWWGGLVET